jgi:hypothetical protein
MGRKKKEETIEAGAKDVRKGKQSKEVKNSKKKDPSMQKTRKKKESPKPKKNAKEELKVTPLPLK